MIKYSHQRECILRNLQNRRDHPTANMVYEGVRAQLPHISLGTVYRNLSFLAESGQILRISTGIGPEHYDGYTAPHNHFVCSVCGKVMDMEYVPQEQIIEKASAGFGGVIDSYELQFSGKCKDCLLDNKQ